MNPSRRGYLRKKLNYFFSVELCFGTMAEAEFASFANCDVLLETFLIILILIKLLSVNKKLFFGQVSKSENLLTSRKL